MEYLLGMDGGGTATKVSIAEKSGKVIAHRTSGALNINGQTAEQFQSTLAEIMQWLNNMGFVPEKCCGIGIGAAGLSNPQTRQLLLEAFTNGGYRAPLFTYTDGETALAAIFPECRGMILIAGTGSICLGRTEDGTLVRAGGYGHLIDDGGSAYKIAIAILSSVVRAEDGRTEPTILRQLVFEKLGVARIEELIGYLYAPDRSKKEIASLAVLLEQAVAEKDRAALEIERNSVKELLNLVHTVMDHLQSEKDIALSGSVLLNNRNIRAQVCDGIRELRKDAHIVLSGQEASEGAIRLLQREKQLCLD